MPDYKIGTDDPPHPHDPGAGVWGSESPELTMRAAKLEIQSHFAEEVVVIGLDAANHMQHYLGNSGTDYTIRLRNMVDGVPSAKRLYDKELGVAKAFVETLPDGTYDITSKKTDHGYNLKSESVNWFFAIGGYTIWGKGKATVSTSGGTRNLALDFEYKFYDRYNWDKGKSVTIFGVTITDDFMGRFHRQGLAMEFDCLGSITDKYTWTSSAPAPAPPVVPPAPVIPPKPPVVPPGPHKPLGGGKTYTVVAGDSLWKIAEKFYGHGSQWQRIYQANKGVIGANPNLIVPGQKLTIP